MYEPTPNPEISSVVAPFDHEKVYRFEFGSPYITSPFQFLGEKDNAPNPVQPCPSVIVILLSAALTVVPGVPEPLVYPIVTFVTVWKP